VADTFVLNGNYSSQPTLGNPSASPTILTPLLESMQLGNQAVKFYQLQSPTPTVTDVVLDFANVNVLVVKVVGGHVRVRITSSDGSQQAIPVTDLLFLMTETNITAIDLLQDAGMLIEVQLFLGQQAT